MDGSPVALAGTEALIELEIDLRDDVVGIEFFGEAKAAAAFPIHWRVATARPRNPGCANKRFRPGWHFDFVRGAREI